MKNKYESGIGAMIVILIAASVLIAGVVAFMVRKNSTSGETLTSASSSSSTSSANESASSGQGGSSVSSVKAEAATSQDIDANLSTLQKESVEVDGSLNDTPIDVMQN